MIFAMEDFAKVERRGKVAILTFNRPDSLNALASHEDCFSIVDALTALERDTSVSAIVITGSGRAFSAGGNLKAMKQRVGIGRLATPDDTRSNYRRGVHKVARALYDCEVPLIAAVNGHAIGLGLDLAALCDMRIAADTARFAASFIKVGIVPGDGGAWALSRAVGYAKAAELFFTGESFGPEEAVAMGLVSRVVPAGTLIDEAVALGEKIAANPARALRMTKRLLREAQNQRLSDVLELSAAFQAIAHETQDHAEAVDAFLEKRPPNFTGA
ncbi:crotonase/enoyl-CoA hydratase family protein [Novosphingobium cyanobacteriorum]|uniref:Crotonase/enoyl-CoA hydratase family protein n=1 Tax=Novosphingobium cyanobacteriorum TaxID=3024215 RepID=A0ABT6CM08_9SPHN|nr:crotonase/enoyl-CoA hydratase family protein [Novosphingobium cyanobacteriorum]MDF8334598.1 crotonase/enoyl-CoA hydratase family protein [Novosphingobium cyanobacteriorum]